MTGTASIPSAARFGFVYDSPYQSTLDAVYVYIVPWSEFPIVPSYPHYPQSGSLPGWIIAKLPPCVLGYGIWGSKAGANNRSQITDHEGP